MFEANLSLSTLAEKLQELKFGEESEDFLKNETEEVMSKMESSFKDSFSQVCFHALYVFLQLFTVADQRSLEAQTRIFEVHQVVSHNNEISPE